MSDNKGIADSFFFNSLLANSLTQFLPAHERLIVRAWLEKLYDLDSNHEDIRDDYMWLLLCSLQTRNLSSPFNKKPKKDDLKPLEDEIDQTVLNEIAASAEKPNDWIKDILSQENPKKKFTANPAQFLVNQPIPRQGIICYIAAFGDEC